MVLLYSFTSNQDVHWLSDSETCSYLPENSIIQSRVHVSLYEYELSIPTIKSNDTNSILPERVNDMTEIGGCYSENKYKS